MARMVGGADGVDWRQGGFGLRYELDRSVATSCSDVSCCKICVGSLVCGVKACPL